MATEFLYRWVKLITHIHVVPMWGISGALPILPPYAFVALTGTNFLFNAVTAEIPVVWYVTSWALDEICRRSGGTACCHLLWFTGFKAGFQTRGPQVTRPASLFCVALQLIVFQVANVARTDRCWRVFQFKMLIITSSEALKGLLPLDGYIQHKSANNSNEISFKWVIFTFYIPRVCIDNLKW